MRMVHGEGGKEVLCTVCGKGFPTVSSARIHEQRHGAKYDFQCPLCPKSFMDKGNLKKHILLHSGLRSFICDVCGNGYKDRTGLKLHMATHGEKTIQCDLCEQRFKKRKTFENHRMIHTGERPNVCPYCQHGFIQISACKQHIFKVHGVEVPKGVGMKKFIEGLEKNPHLVDPEQLVNHKAVRGRKPRSPTSLSSQNRLHDIGFAPHSHS